MSKILYLRYQQRQIPRFVWPLNKAARRSLLPIVLPTTLSKSSSEQPISALIRLLSPCWPFNAFFSVPQVGFSASIIWSSLFYTLAKQMLPSQTMFLCLRKIYTRSYCTQPPFVGPTYWSRTLSVASKAHSAFCNLSLSFFSLSTTKLWLWRAGCPGLIFCFPLCTFSAFPANVCHNRLSQIQAAFPKKIYSVTLVVHEVGVTGGFVQASCFWRGLQTIGSLKAILHLPRPDVFEFKLRL